MLITKLERKIIIISFIYLLSADIMLFLILSCNGHETYYVVYKYIYYIAFAPIGLVLMPVLLKVWRSDSMFTAHPIFGVIPDIMIMSVVIAMVECFLIIVILRIISGYKNRKPKRVINR